MARCVVCRVISAHDRADDQTGVMTWAAFRLISVSIFRHVFGHALRRWPKLALAELK